MLMGSHPLGTGRLAIGASAYPPSADTWETRSQLMVDVLGLVEKYE